MSRRMLAHGGTSPAALVIDDTSATLTYTGAGWKHQTGQLSVAYGTQAVTNTKGDAVTYTFEGNRITWYSRMGPDKGIAAVYLDGQLDRLVDTYDTDEIPNIAVYRRSFPKIEKHTLKIVALGVQTGTRLAVQLDAEAGLESQIKGAVHKSASELLQDAGDTTNHQIVVDGFQVDRAPMRLVQHVPDQGIVYRGRGWQHTSSTAASPANAARQGESVSSVSGDQATYTFTGSGMSWIGQRCSTCGMADVYVDGRLVTTVDTYVSPLRVDSLL